MGRLSAENPVLSDFLHLDFAVGKIAEFYEQLRRLRLGQFPDDPDISGKFLLRPAPGQDHG